MTVSPALQDALDEARNEADELENDETENDEDETDDEPVEDEPEPEPASDALIEQIGANLDKEARRHSKAVEKIMGDQMGDLAACPLCVTPGYVTAVPPDDFDPDQREAVLAAMGDGIGGYKQHSDLTTCDRCGGLGHLLTGAKNEANYLISCPDCQSKGYVNPKEQAAMEQAMLDASPSYIPPAPPVGLANGSPGLAGSPDQQPWYDYATATWKLP